MKPGWESAKLKDICVVDWGNTNLTKAAYVDDGEFLAVSAAGCDGRIRHKEHAKYTPVLSAIGAQCGKMFFPEEDFTAIKNTITLTPKSDLCSNRFLYYLLNFVELPKRGAGQPFISKGDIQNFQIKCPPIPEQHRIVAILDEAFEGIATAKANAENNLQNARALFESHLQSVFTQRGEGWVEIPIGELCQRLHQGLNTAGEKIKFVETGYPIIQTRNIDEGIVDLDHKMKFMSEYDWHLYRDKYRPEIGDVFFTNIGTIGKTAIVTEERDFLIHWNIFKLRPNFNLIGPAYLRYALEQLTLSGYFKRMQKGGTVDFVTKKMISEAILPLPSMAKQAEIVCQLNAVHDESKNLEAIYQRKLEALDQLKQSLLHQAFFGLL